MEVPMTRIIRIAVRASLCLLLVGPAAAGDAPEPPDPTPTPPAQDAQPPPVVREVGEVLAASSRGERDNLLVPSNSTVIDRAAIEKSGARDLPDLLRREAGLFVTQSTGNPEGYTVEARGFNNGGGNGSRTLVLVDGRRVNEPRSDGPDWALIPLDRVERIEIVRGPASAAWGDNAMGGVIHVQTRGGEGAPRFEARGGLGSYGNWSGSVFGGGSAGPVTASLSAHDEKDGGYRDRSLFRSHGGELKLGLDVGERVHLGVKTGYSSDVRNRPGTLDEVQKWTDRRQAEPSDDDNFQISRQRHVDGTVEVALADDVTLTSVAWYQLRRDQGALATSEFAFDELADSWALGANTQLEVDRAVLGHENQLVVGGDWLRERFRPESRFDVFDFPPPSRTDKRSKRTLYGFFLQDDFSLREDLIFSAGVRYDRNHREGTDLIVDPAFPKASQFETHDSEWSPRGALTWRVCDPVALYASYAEGFRFPNLDEAFGAFGFAPALEPETSRSYEVGAKLRTERFRANVAVYQMKVTNEIYFDTERAFPFGENVNLGRVRHQGVEAWGDARPWDWLELYASYTYDDVKLTHDPLTMLESHRMPLVPHHRGTAGGLVTLPAAVELGVNVNWVGARFALNDVANVFSTLSAWSSWDAHVAWRPQLGDHLRLNFIGILYNLFDREYSEVGGIRTFFDATLPPFGDFARERRFFPSPERNWEARVTIEVWR
jgi:outer membrane receptor protein involved in Fe transport